MLMLVWNNPVLERKELIQSRPPPESEYLLVRIRNRDYLRISGFFLEKSLALTKEIVDSMNCMNPEGDDAWAREMKVLSYLHLMLKNYRTARTNEQLRLRYLLKHHER